LYFWWWPHGATTAVLQQLFFFSRRMAPASFNFSLKFSECRRRAVQKRNRKVVEQWLYGALTDTAHLFSSASTIFLPLRGTNCLCAPARRPDWNRSAGDPSTTGTCLAVLNGVACSWTWASGASFSLQTARKGCATATIRWLLTTMDHFLTNSETMHFQLRHLIHDVSPKFQNFQKIHNV
jgi:hypothetical protein